MACDYKDHTWAWVHTGGSYVFRECTTCGWADRDCDTVVALRDETIALRAERDALAARVAGLLAAESRLAASIGAERDALRGLVAEMAEAMTQRDTCFVCGALMMEKHMRDHCIDCVTNDDDHDPQHFNTVAYKQWERLLADPRVLTCVEAAKKGGAK
jgi:hypothetical protein